MADRKRIAVIGGGFSGMTSIVMLKEENLEPFCFEKTDHHGGTWYYREESIEQVASIMPTTIINHSKELGAYSNFPPPATCNNYMRHWELYEYFMSYWIKNDCLNHVQYNTECIEAKRTEDYEETGQWLVNLRNTISGEMVQEVFDGVLICVGHINRSTMPTYVGQELFEGEVLHSHSLKGVEKYRNKNVCVVGIGCSGLDAAVETSNVAKQVYLSTKNGAHIINRVGLLGYPVDTVILRRCFTFVLDILPASWASYLCERMVTDHVFHKNLLRVPPKSHLLAKDPILNDHIFSKLLSGAVIQKPDIGHFTDKGVVFESENQVTEIDTVIMATGYTWKFPFIDDTIIMDDNGMVNLYKCMYPPHLKHPSLAFIGFILPFGPGFPLAEIQCRLAARVFAGKCNLPDPSVMLKDNKRRQKYNETRYTPNKRMNIRVDFTQYMDDISSIIGAKPNLMKLFFRDIRLFCKLVFGPCVPYQYRIYGPHKWEGAREAVMTSEDRMVAPLGGTLPRGYLNLVFSMLFRFII